MAPALPSALPRPHTGRPVLSSWADVLGMRLLSGALAVTVPVLAAVRVAAGHRPRLPPEPRSAVELTPAVFAVDGPVKKPLSAYLHFCAERRASLTAELKASEGAAFKHTGVMRALGAEWGALADRSKYEALAAEDKARYATAKASAPAAKKPASRAKAGAKRPPSAYLLFCAERRASPGSGGQSEVRD